MRLHRSLIASTLGLLLTACGSSGGGSSSGGSPADRSFTLHVATGGDGPDIWTARVAGVMFEADDGSFTSNLLQSPTAVTLIDPAGSASGLALLPPPARTNYAAMLLVLEGGSATVRRADGSSQSVPIGGGALRIGIVGAFDPARGDDLVVEAGAVIAGVPGFVASTRPDITLMIGSAVVVAVDAATGTITATVPAYQGVAFELRIAATTQLLGDDGRGRGRDDFLVACRADSELSLQGSRSDSRTIDCSSMHHRGAHQEDSGYLGQITSIDSGSMSFELMVQASVSSGNYGPAPFANLSVDASAAVLYSSHRSVRTEAVFGDLVVGSVVEVEGVLTAATSLRAREVELEDDHQGGQPGEIEGQVVGVDVGAGTIAIGPRGDDPLIVGGTSVAAATIVIDTATRIERRASGGSENIGLGDVSTGDRIWVRGSVETDRRVLATWVRIDSRP